MILSTHKSFFLGVSFCAFLTAYVPHAMASASDQPSEIAGTAGIDDNPVSIGRRAALQTTVETLDLLTYSIPTIADMPEITQQTHIMTLISQRLNNFGVSFCNESELYDALNKIEPQQLQDILEMAKKMLDFGIKAGFYEKIKDLFEKAHKSDDFQTQNAAYLVQYEQNFFKSVEEFTNAVKLLANDLSKIRKNADIQISPPRFVRAARSPIFHAPQDTFFFTFPQLNQEFTQINQAWQLEAPNTDLTAYTPMYQEDAQTTYANSWKFIQNLLLERDKRRFLSPEEKDLYEGIIVSLQGNSVSDAFNVSFIEYINAYRQEAFYQKLYKFLRCISTDTAIIENNHFFLNELKEIKEAYEKKARSNALAMLDEINAMLGVTPETP